MTWAGHGHDDVCDPEQFAKPETFEKIMSFSPYIGVNLDIGHFTAAGYDAVTFIRRYHDRITNLHLKDRIQESAGQRPRRATCAGATARLRSVKCCNCCGGSSIRFPPTSSTNIREPIAVIEVAKCLQFAKDILVG